MILRLTCFDGITPPAGLVYAHSLYTWLWIAGHHMLYNCYVTVKYLQLLTATQTCCVPRGSAVNLDCWLDLHLEPGSAIAILS